MTPIIDVRGNVIAFGGRVLDDSKPKYVNTSDTVVDTLVKMIKYDHEEMHQLIQICKKNDLYVLVDEIYRGLYQEESISDLYEKGIATSGLSKVVPVGLFGKFKQIIFVFSLIFFSNSSKSIFHSFSSFK